MNSAVHAEPAGHSDLEEPSTRSPWLLEPAHAAACVWDSCALTSEELVPGIETN